MHKTIISTPSAPAAIGAYSQAVKVGDTVYLSGQIPLNPESMTLVSGEFAEQAHQVFKNLAAVLTAAQLNWQHVVKLNVYLVDLGNFAVLNEIMAEYLQEPFPARAAIQVAALPRGALIEIDGVACA